MGSARVGSVERVCQKDRQLPILQINVDALRVNLGCALESEIPVKELKGLETQDFHFFFHLLDRRNKWEYAQQAPHQQGEGYFSWMVAFDGRMEGSWLEMEDTS